MNKILSRYLLAIVIFTFLSVQIQAETITTSCVSARNLVKQYYHQQVIASKDSKTEANTIPLLVYEGYQQDYTVVRDEEKTEEESRNATGFYTGTITKMVKFDYVSYTLTDKSVDSIKSELQAKNQPFSVYATAIESFSIRDKCLESEDWFLNKPIEIKKEKLSVSEAAQLLETNYGMVEKSLERQIALYGTEIITIPKEGYTVRDILYDILERSKWNKELPRAYQILPISVMELGSTDWLTHPENLEITSWTILALIPGKTQITNNE